MERVLLRGDDGDDFRQRKRLRFDPAALSLPADFVLTDYARLKGCSCKVPQQKLLELLVASNIAASNETSSCAACETSKDAAVVGLDCSVVPLPTSFGYVPSTTKTQIHGCGQDGSAEGLPRRLYLVSTTDFFFPSVEDPYLQGVIACANVLSDLYAMGIEKCDSLLMLLASSTEMDEHERFVVTKEMMRGFGDTARLAGTTVAGGQTVMNPWPLIGGVATSVVPEGDMIQPDAGLFAPGQCLVLTKPLGNQIAVNLMQWVKRPSPLYKARIEGKMSTDDIEQLYSEAVSNMCELNLIAARLMKKFGALGCTDVTGFGLLGHGRNLAAAQDPLANGAKGAPPKVQFVFEALPILEGAARASLLIDDKYKLFSGLAAETSGGLLVVFPNQDVANRYVAELASARISPAQPSTVQEQCTTRQSWIVGRVVERVDASQPAAIVAANAQLLRVGSRPS